MMHRVRVKKEKETLLWRESAQKRQTTIQGRLDLAVGATKRIGELVEPAVETVVSSHQSAFGVTGGGKTVAGKSFGDGLDLR